MRRLARVLFLIITVALVLQRPAAIQAEEVCYLTFECQEWIDGDVCVWGIIYENCYDKPDDPGEIDPGDPGGGGGSGGTYPEPTLEISEASIENDRVVVQLGGDGNVGRLQVLAHYGGGSHVLFDEAHASGTLVTNFRKPDLPEGDYLEVEAIWDVQLSRRARNARSAPYLVLGVYHHSQYNTPDENKCDGAYDTEREISESTNRCNEVIPTGRNGHPGLKFIFSQEVTENGSGFSTHYGTLGKSYTCRAHSHYTKIAQPMGSDGPVNTSTVAVIAGHPYLTWGDRVDIVGVGVKTLTDTCDSGPGGCLVKQLDNYSSLTGCRKKSVP